MIFLALKEENVSKILIVFVSKYGFMVDCDLWILKTA